MRNVSPIARSKRGPRSGATSYTRTCDAVGDTVREFCASTNPSAVVTSTDTLKGLPNLGGVIVSIDCPVPMRAGTCEPLTLQVYMRLDEGTRTPPFTADDRRHRDKGHRTSSVWEREYVRERRRRRPGLPDDIHVRRSDGDARGANGPSCLRSADTVTVVADPAAPAVTVIIVFPRP